VTPSWTSLSASWTLRPRLLVLVRIVYFQR
jgi:hypothetical protein